MSDTGKALVPTFIKLQKPTRRVPLPPSFVWGHGSMMFTLVHSLWIFCSISQNGLINDVTLYRGWKDLLFFKVTSNINKISAVIVTQNTRSSKTMETLQKVSIILQMSWHSCYNDMPSFLLFMFYIFVRFFLFIIFYIFTRFYLFITFYIFILYIKCYICILFVVIFYIFTSFYLFIIFYIFT